MGTKTTKTRPGSPRSSPRKKRPTPSHPEPPRPTSCAAFSTPARARKTQTHSPSRTTPRSPTSTSSAPPSQTSRSWPPLPALTASLSPTCFIRPGPTIRDIGVLLSVSRSCSFVLFIASCSLAARSSMAPEQRISTPLAAGRRARTLAPRLALQRLRVGNLFIRKRRRTKDEPLDREERRKRIVAGIVARQLRDNPVNHPRLFQVDHRLVHRVCVPVVRKRQVGQKEPNVRDRGRRRSLEQRPVPPKVGRRRHDGRD